MTLHRQRREIARARERADLARLRFNNAAHSTVEQLKPRHLVARARHALDERVAHARHRIARSLHSWPVRLGIAAVAAAALGGIALKLRRPARSAVHSGGRLVRFARDRLNFRSSRT